MNALNILVVDDEQPLADAIAQYVSGNGRKVETRYDPSGALDLILREAVDLVIADVVFPEEGMDGIGLLEKAKEIFPDVEFVLMSGYGNTEREKLTRKWGGLRFFHKPLDLALLNELVAAVERKRTDATENEAIVPHVPGIISDEEAARLQREYLAGREGALDVILTGYRNLVFSVATGWYHLDREDAEDLYQDVCVEVMVKISRIKKLRPFVVGTAMNLCKKVLKKNARYTSLPPDYSGRKDPGADPGMRLRREEIADQLSTAMRILNEKERALVRATIIDGDSYRSVSERHGIPIGSIGPTRQKALRKMRAYLTQNREAGYGRPAS